MKERPQMRVTPSLGVFFIDAAHVLRAAAIQSEARGTRADAKDPLAQLLETLARLLGIPVPQPVPVRVRR